MDPAAAVAMPAPRRSVYFGLGLLLFLAALGGLFYYKWAGSIKAMGDSTISAKLATASEKLTAGSVWEGTLFYLQRVWIALVFGVLIGATARTFIPASWIAGLLGEGNIAKRQMAGGLLAAPLMLCSCCVTPIFTGVYERGASLGSALALMLGSPGLNIAALILTFTLFPLNLSIARAAGAVAAVFILPAIVERLFGKSVESVRASRLKSAKPEGQEPRTLGDFAWTFVKNLAYITVVTIPFVVAGVALSAVLAPHLAGLTQGGAIAATAIVAAVAVMIALPTFFEIPLALTLTAAGQPGAAVAILVAGPIVNLPSLFVLAREANIRVTVAVAAGVWLIAFACGVAVIV